MTIFANFTKTMAAGALAVGMSAGMAGAATVNLLDNSVQGIGNTAGIDYAERFAAYTPQGATWSTPDPTHAAGNVPGNAQSPFNNNALTDTRDYFAVGTNVAGEPVSATLSFSSLQSSFDILWGSIDSYNTIDFLDSSNATVFSYTGADLAFDLGLNGGPNFEHVALVNFSGFGDNGFDSVKFTSSSPAFEFALAPIPLPAAGLLLLGALGGIAALRRRKSA